MTEQAATNWTVTNLDTEEVHNFRFMRAISTTLNISYNTLVYHFTRIKPYKTEAVIEQYLIKRG